MISDSQTNAALVANGFIENDLLIAPLIKKHTFIVAVDGGLHHCHRMNIIPDLIIGDLDSCSSELLSQYENVPTQRYPTEKDESDLELAILTVQDRFQKMTLFGALGGRADHALYNLHLLRRYPHKVSIETEKETVLAINQKTQLKTLPGQTLSLLPLGPVKNISSQGLKWELSHAIFDKKLMSLSNVSIKDIVEIEIEEGDLICFIQKNI